MNPVPKMYAEGPSTLGGFYDYDRGEAKPEFFIVPHLMFRTAALPLAPETIEKLLAAGLMFVGEILQLCEYDLLCLGLTDKEAANVGVAIRGFGLHLHMRLTPELKQAFAQSRAAELWRQRLNSEITIVAGLMEILFIELPLPGDSAEMVVVFESCDILYFGDLPAAMDEFPEHADLLKRYAEERLKISLACFGKESKLKAWYAHARNQRERIEDI